MDRLFYFYVIEADHRSRTSSVTEEERHGNQKQLTQTHCELASYRAVCGVLCSSRFFFETMYFDRRFTGAFTF